MTQPKLYIMLLTYAHAADSARAGYAKTTLKTTLDNIQYDGPISVHIADDGSPEAHRKALAKLAGGYKHVQGVTITNAERRGYGASYNLATQVIHQFANVVLPLEDDWELAHPLDLSGYVEALDDSGPISCIRLGYLGYTQVLKGELGRRAGKQFLLFDPESPERHVCAGHPRIETVGFERRVGPWQEGIDAGTTEFVWCGQPEARIGVAWPMDAPSGGWFQHIGTVQAREDQREAVAV